MVFKLAGRVEGIDVDNNEPCTQDGKHGNGILQQVRHHDGDAVAFFHAGQRLQISGKVLGHGSKL